jgi:hypothetical protein
MRAGSSPSGRDARRMAPTARSFCAGSLLLATVIQGMTPDAYDLASDRIFHLLMQGVLSSSAGRDSEGSQGELSDPGCIADSPALRGRVKLAHARGLLPCGRIAELIAKKVVPAPNTRGNPPSPVPLITLLCHLTC